MFADSEFKNPLQYRFQFLTHRK